MNKPIPDQHPNASLYCQLMEYIKWRVSEVQKTLSLTKENKHYLSNRSAAEFCLLQCRMVCELIAIGCVAVHIDVQQTNKLLNQWNADDIMKRLERLKPEYFPAPIDETHSADGKIHTQHRIYDAINQKTLLSSYHFFGENLHTGTFSRYLEKEIKEYDFAIIEKFVSDIIKLLNIHTFWLHNNRKMVRVIMQNVSDGRVWWNEFDRIADQSEIASGPETEAVTRKIDPSGNRT